MNFVFASVRNPNVRYKIWDKYDSNPAYDWTRAHNILDRNLSTYDTMGDGEVQHSPDYCPGKNWDTLRDVIDSLVVALPNLADRALPDGMVSMFRCHAAENIRHHPEQVELARKVEYVAGKTRYYNLEDFKLSTSDSKRHDKRWERVDSDLDGTEASMVRLLSNKHRGNSLLGWMFILEAINDVAKLGYGFTSRHATDGIFRDADPDEVRDCFERASLIRQYVEARVNAVSLIERATRTGEFLLRRLSEKTAVA